MIKELLTTKDGTTVYACNYSEGCFFNVPWGNQTFDCYLVNRHPSLSARQMKAIALELVPQNNDWIETFGPNAEQFHDFIDIASVEIGRQIKVGEGYPMTVWHEEYYSNESIAEKVIHGVHGGNDIFLIVAIGKKDDEQQLRDAILACFNQGEDEDE